MTTGTVGQDARSILGEGTLTSKLKWLMVGAALLVEAVLTIQLIMGHLKDPIMQAIAAIGTCMLAVSLLMLPRQLFNGDIKAGTHRTIAISVLVVELLVMTMNLIVALNTPTGWMDLYARFVLPATPAIVVAGAMLIWLFDPLDRAKLEREQSMVAADILDARFQAKIHFAKAEYAARYLGSDEFQDQIAEWARAEVAATLNKLTRGSIAGEPQLLPPGDQAGADAVDVTPRETTNTGNLASETPASAVEVPRDQGAAEPMPAPAAATTNTGEQPPVDTGNRRFTLAEIKEMLHLADLAEQLGLAERLGFTADAAPAVDEPQSPRIEELPVLVVEAGGLPTNGNGHYPSAEAPAKN